LGAESVNQPKISSSEAYHGSNGFSISKIIRANLEAELLLLLF